MTKVIVDKSKIDLLANAISDKSGESLTMTLDEMVEAVDSIETGGGEPNLQAKTNVSPTTSSQTIQADSGYDGLSSVQINAMPSGSVSASAAKGSVSNHAISVTPTATVGTAGYIAAGSTNGTAVSVSASELVSGSQTITENDTYDVTNLASVVVNVSGGGSDVAVDAIAEPTSGTSTTLTFSNLKGEPTSFFVMADESLTPGATAYVEAIAYDGTSYHAQTITNTSNAQISYSSTGLSHSYSNGTLTVTSTGTAINTVIPYTLTYTYGGSSGNILTSDVQVGSGATSITFANLDDEPICWSLIFKSNFGTSSGYQRVICVRNNATNIVGLEMDSSAKLSVSHWTDSYSNGSLTITSQGTNAGGYFHQPGYYQLTYAVSGDQSMQTKTVTPTTSTQNVTADTGYTGLKKVVVNPIPSSYVQPTSTVGATTYRASTSAQTIQSGTYHSAAATIAAVSQTNLSAENIKSGTTISISNGQSNLWSVTGSYTGGGGGSASVATTTWTNSSNTTTTHQFTGLSGTPKAAFLRCTSSLSRSSSSTNYFIADMSWDGTTCKGNSFRRSNGTYANVTSGYTVTTGSNSITFTSSGTSTTNPGSFYNGTYELVYVY